MAVAPYRVHRMIQDLMRDPQAAAAYAADPAPTQAHYGLEPRETALLAKGTLEAMTELGVHPNMQMKYLRLSAPPPGAGALAKAGPLDAYLDRLLEN